MKTVLIVDDDRNILRTLELFLADQGFETVTAGDGRTAIQKAKERRPEVIFLDLRLPDLDGLAVLKEITEARLKAYVVVITAYATVETAVKAVKLGAFDYLAKPFTPAQIEHVLEMIRRVDGLEAEVESLRQRLKGIESQGDLVTRNRKMRAVLKMAHQVAESNASVLLTGESGTGKGLLAQLIHDWSPRKQGPFVQVDCTVLQENLLESDLFGHAKGSFTGAVADKRGKLDEADRGTVFLDEVTEMSVSVQAKLLRFLQSREFTRLGETKPRQVDARIVAATNRDLEQAVREGVFREDLFYRLNVVEISLPPLRERPDDVELLAELFLKKFVQENQRGPKTLARSALEVMKAYPWPGNVRELMNAVQRATIVSTGEELSPADLPPHLIAYNPLSDQSEIRRSLSEVEREHIQRVLIYAQTLEEASAILGIDPATLWRKRKKYRLG